MATTLTPDPATGPEASTDEPGIALAPRVVLAALSAGAGVVHLAMAPVHAANSTLEGVGFAAAGWLQLLVAVGLVVRASRPLLQATIVANLVFIGLWAWSRTTGLPVGSHAGTSEPVGTIDLLTVVLEGALVVGAAAVLLRPALGRVHGSGALVVASVVPAAVLIATTLAVASPSASEHDHSLAATGPAPGSIEAQLASIDANRCDKDINPVAYWNEAAQAGVDTVGIPLTDLSTPSDGHGHSHTAAAPTPTTTMPDPLEGRGSPTLDKIVAKMDSDSEVDAGILVAELANTTDVEYQAFLYQLRKMGAGSHAHAATGDDTGGHGGHIGPSPWIAMTDPAQCEQLKRELEIARETALALPTAADAKAAGYTQVTPYVPGIAAHWMKFSYVDGTFEVDKPEMVLYDGNGPDARVVGLSYYLLHQGELEPTQGFTGPNDHFHRHIGLCQAGAMVIGDSTTTEEECAARGGRKATNRGGWMNHVWIVPGCESPWGMFSGASPLLDWQLFERSGTDGGSCNGSKAKARYDLSPGSPSVTTTTNPATERAAGR